MNRDWLQIRKVVQSRCENGIRRSLSAQIKARPFRQVLDQIWTPVFEIVRTGRLVIDGQLFEQTMLEDQRDEKERP